MTTTNTTTTTTKATATIETIDLRKTLKSLDNSLAILDTAELSQHQFLVAISVATRSDKAREVIAAAMANKCSVLLDWLNHDASPALLSAVKNHIQRINGRYASRTHTIAEQGGVYSYVARLQSDIDSHDIAELAEKLNKAGWTATKKCTLQALKTADRINTMLLANATPLTEIGYTLAKQDIDLTNVATVNALSDIVKSQVDKALSQRKQLLADRKRYQSNLALLSVAECDAVQVGLLDKLRGLKLDSANDVKHALSYLNTVQQLIKYKLPAASADNLQMMQDILSDYLDARVVDTDERLQDVMKHAEKVEKTASVLKHENTKLKEQVTTQDSLDFLIGKDDLAYANALSNGLDTIINAFLSKNDGKTTINTRLLVAKVLHDKSIALAKIASMSDDSFKTGTNN
jgi:hypothetical protein